jgi:diguanylate cyclase (GGDEF)-like protein
MWTLNIISTYFIEFRKKASQGLISRKGLICVGTLIITLLLVIFSISINLVQQLSKQDDLTTLGILRSTRAFDNINIEILHLIIFLHTSDRNNPELLEQQLNVLDSRFIILERQKSLDTLPVNLRQNAVDLIQEWHELLPVIKRSEIKNEKQVDFILKILNDIHENLTDLILQNQNLRFQQYEIISNSRQNMVHLFIRVFVLFLLIIAFMIYLTIEFIKERQDILNDRMKLMEDIQNKNNILERMAMVDELTQVANRRYFNLVFDQEWWRLLREKKPLSMILADVDCFKLYNDYYGHQKGDECLYQVAQILRRQLQRPTDLVARYGGEEFLMLLPNTPLNGAIIIVDKIQQELRHRHLPHLQSTVTDCITLSLGIVCIIPNSDFTQADLIAKADQLLYLAKKLGRNQYQSMELSSPLRS